MGLTRPSGVATKFPRILFDISSWHERARWLSHPIPTVLALFAACFLITGYIAYFILEAIPHVQDSVAYLFQAKTFAIGKLWVPTPPMPEFFEHEFILNHDGKWFSKYPPGYPLVLALGVLAGQPWLVNPVLSSFTLVLVYLIGREVYGWSIGLAAALLGLTSPFFLFLAGSFMAHPSALFFTALFTLLFIKRVRGASWLWGLGAGASLGMVFLIRPWTAIGISTPFVFYALFRVIIGHWPEIRRFLPIAIGGIAVGSLLPAYNYIMTGDPFLNPMVLWWDFDRIGFGEGIGMHGPHSFVTGLANTGVLLTLLAQHLYGWPYYLSLAFIPLPFLLRRANQWDWLFAAGATSLVFAHIFYWAQGIMYGPRYYYEIVAFLFLLTARGIQTATVALADWLSRASLSGSGLALLTARWLVYGLATLFVSYNLFLYLPEQWENHKGYNYVSAASINTVKEAGVHNAVVFVDPGQRYEWWNYGAIFSSNSPNLDTDVVYARDLGNNENRRLKAIYPDRRAYDLRDGKLTPPDWDSQR